MKYKHIIVVFVLGCIIQLFGAMCKIIHAPGAHAIMKLSFAVMMLAGILLIVKLLKSKEGFLNR